MADEETIDTKRYDRQIRLWGLDTQRGLIGAHILLLGVNGLTNEIAKNLVLAGVGHVHIQDPGDLEPADIATGGLFSVSSTQLGTGRAEALAAALREMNPQVELVPVRQDASSLDADFLRQFQFVISTRGIEAVREISALTSLLERHPRAPQDADPQGGTPAAAAEPSAKRQRADGDGTPAVPRSNGGHIVAPVRFIAPEAGPEALAPPHAAPKLLAAGCLGLDGFCIFDLGICSSVIPAAKKLQDESAPSAAAQAAPPPAAPPPEFALYPTVTSASQVAWAALTPRVPRLYYSMQLLLAQAAASVTHDDAATPAAEELEGVLPGDAAPETVKLLRGLVAQRTRLLETAESNREAAKLLTTAYLAQVCVCVRACVRVVACCTWVGGQPDVKEP